VYRYYSCVHSTINQGHRYTWCGSTVTLTRKGPRIHIVVLVILTAVTVFWNAKTCSSVEGHWRFRRRCSLHIQYMREIRIKFAALPPASCWYQGLAYSLTWRWRQYASLKHWWTSTKLHGVTSWKIVSFKSSYSWHTSYFPVLPTTRSRQTKSSRLVYFF
jgi:hypothetical protein